VQKLSLSMKATGFSRSARTRGLLARRQQMIGARLVLRNCLLKTSESGCPQLDTLDVCVDAVERLDQIADDQIFRRLGYRYGGLLVRHVLPSKTQELTRFIVPRIFRRSEIPWSHANRNNF
jgi:hypothetical protein